jgi:hypothetical protein
MTARSKRCKRVQKMRSLSFVLAFVGLFVFPNRTSAQGNSEEQAIRKVIVNFAEVINRSGAPPFQCSS